MQFKGKDAVTNLDLLLFWGGIDCSLRAITQRCSFSQGRLALQFMWSIEQFYFPNYSLHTGTGVPIMHNSHINIRL